MATPFDALYTAAKAIMVDVNTAATETVLTQAPTNYGEDFRITPGAGVYQVQMTPEKDYPLSSNESYPRAIVTIRIHHYVLKFDSMANEDSFLHDTMYQVTNLLTDAATWQAEAGIYDLQPEIDPVIDPGEREGNVITFEASAVVLMDAV